MYLILLSFGMVLVVHSLLLTVVMKKNNELSKQIQRIKGKKKRLEKSMPPKRNKK